MFPKFHGKQIGMPSGTSCKITFKKFVLFTLVFEDFSKNSWDCMRLGSGSITRNHKRISKRRTRMVGSRSADTSTNINEGTSGPTNASSMPAASTNPSGSMVNLMVMPSIAQEAVGVPPSTTASILITPRPTVPNDFRPYMPSFTMPSFFDVNNHMACPHRKWQGCILTLRHSQIMQPQYYHSLIHIWLKGHP